MRLALLLAVTVDAPAQQPSSLPPEMIASFAPRRIWAEEFWLPTAANDQVRGRVRFENQDPVGKVVIDWYFVKAGASSRQLSQVVEVAFRPTAVARRAGTTDTLYVVGWSDRMGRVVVEEWTFGPTTLGSTLPENGEGGAISVFAPPPIAKELAWVSDPGTVPPIWDAACEVYANKLLLLTSGTTTKIVSLDLVTLSLQQLYSSTSNPALGGLRMLSIARHPVAGFTVIAEQRRSWDAVGHGEAVDNYFVMRDVDANGTLDTTEVVASNAFYVIYPPPWNNRYEQ